MTDFYRLTHVQEWTHLLGDEVTYFKHGPEESAATAAATGRGFRVYLIVDLARSAELTEKPAPFHYMVSLYSK